MIATNTATRWEIVLSNGANSFRLQFSARRGKAALLRAMSANAELILRESGLGDSPDSDAFIWDRKAAAWVYGAWAVRFSGKTERDIFNRIAA